MKNDFVDLELKSCAERKLRGLFVVHQKMLRNKGIEVHIIIRSGEPELERGGGTTLKGSGTPADTVLKGQNMRMKKGKQAGVFSECAYPDNLFFI